MSYRKLGRNSSARKALFRSILASFFKHERIETTEAKAKEVRSLAEKYTERPGGYTRILKLGPRRGDAAPMALLELV